MNHDDSIEKAYLELLTGIRGNCKDYIFYYYKNTKEVHIELENSLLCGHDIPKDKRTNFKNILGDVEARIYAAEIQNQLSEVCGNCVRTLYKTK